MAPTAVVLLTMGEPESLREVRPFLRALLSDPHLVPFPVPALQPVFAWAVSRLGGGRLRRCLAAIGGGSPLKRLTVLQGRALEQALRPDGEFRVYAAMRYGQPSAADAARRLLADGARRVVALPLYPQYCRATTGSSLEDLRLRLKEQGAGLPVREVRSWPEHPGYVRALVRQVSAAVAQAPDGRAHLLFSAHGVPEAFIRSGDPYQCEVERTVAALRCAFRGLPSSLCYQGRTGRGRWLGPDAAVEAARLGRSGVKSLVVVPVSFVSDHSETLFELDLALRRTAEDAGVKTFLRVPALNSQPDFIAALRDLALDAEAAP